MAPVAAAGGRCAAPGRAAAHAFSCTAPCARAVAAGAGLLEACCSMPEGGGSSQVVTLFIETPLLLRRVGFGTASPELAQ